MSNEKPVSIEQQIVYAVTDTIRDIVYAVTDTIRDAVGARLSAWDSPIKPMIDSVINKHTKEISTLVDEVFMLALSSQTFKKALAEELEQKLAKTLISRMGGELEKQVIDLKQNPETRAKITLAISNVVTELIKAPTKKG